MAVTRIPSLVSSRPTQDMREPSPESGLTLKEQSGLLVAVMDINANSARNTLLSRVLADLY